MTDYAEEQANEIEALQSIYPNEFEELTQSPWRFLIAVQPEAGDDLEEDEKCSVTLKFALGASYPDEVPVCTVHSCENLEDEECDDMIRQLGEEAEANIGMVMVFTLVSAAQEYLNAHQDAAKKSRLDAIKAKEEEERRKAETPVFFGTPVSEASFYEWKAKFQAEMASTRTVKLETGKKKLSGKELFECNSSLAQSDIQLLELDDEDLTEDAGEAAAGGNSDADVDVDESLFEDLDDLGLDADLDIT